MRLRSICRGWALVLALSCSATLLGQAFWRLTEQQEIELGRQAASQVEKDQPLLRDAGIEKFLDDLGQTLVKKSGRPAIPYTFRVLDSPDVNAFALPGGFIFVNRGLIESADTKSELAGVLAHEIGHVVGRHGVEQARRGTFLEAGLRALGGLFGDSRSADLGRMASELVAAGAFMRFSREAERQADRYGAQMLFDTGFNPQGMVSFFEKLASTGQSQPGVVEKFFASHPSLQDRANNIADLLKQFASAGNLQNDSPEFQAVKTRLASLPRTGSTHTAAARPHGHTATRQVPELSEARRHRDREIASLFAPVFHHGLGPSPRFDYLTNFDFDGDWRGDNNWQNAGDPKFPLKAYVYYAVMETPSHFFVHYAAFHPRDYKGGPRQGVALSEAIRIGVDLGGQYDPTGRANEAVLAHENDLEGALVIAEKNGEDPQAARLVLAQSLAHNAYLKYVPEGSALSGFDPVVVDARRAHFFIEPRGHGIEAWRPDNSQCQLCENGTLVYTFTGQAENPEERPNEPVGYDLLPTYSTFWPRAQNGGNETYGEEHDYGTITAFAVDESGTAAEKQVQLGVLGSALNGLMGGRHMARPPWGWFDGQERDRPLGEWFLQPAEVVRRHFNLGSALPVAYTYNPFLSIFPKDAVAARTPAAGESANK
jgi:Zn-dependent protease with chaperone function